MSKIHNAIHFLNIFHFPRSQSENICENSMQFDPIRYTLVFGYVVCTDRCHPSTNIKSICNDIRLE